MEPQEIYSRLQSLFDDLFMERVVVTPELSAKEVAEWDSLMQISLVVAVEKEFGVRFRTGEVEATKNLGEFVALIQKRAA